LNHGKERRNPLREEQEETRRRVRVKESERKDLVKNVSLTQKRPEQKSEPAERVHCSGRGAVNGNVRQSDAWRQRWRRRNDKQDQERGPGEAKEREQPEPEEDEEEEERRETDAAGVSEGPRGEVVAAEVDRFE
jgi:hypothetical protein